MQVNTISIDAMIANAEGQDLVKQKTVDFLVKYPKNYTGLKIMAEGSVQNVALDAAEHFAKMGIGSIVEPVAGDKPADTVPADMTSKVFVDAKQTEGHASAPESTKEVKNQK